MTDPRDVLSRPGSPPDAVIRYGSAPEHVVDLRLPLRRDRPHPLVVLLHGGFWRSVYDRTHTRPMADGLVAAGYAVATPEFARTGAGGGWPSTFDDVALAVARVPELVSEFTDITGIVLVGHSAGGQLALWCASSNLPRAYAGVVALAPVADLTAAFRLDLDRGAVRALLGGSPEEVPERYDSCDPCRLPPPTGRVVVLHGAEDGQVPVEGSTRYAAHAGAALRVLPGVEHFGLIDPTSAAWAAVLEAVRSVQDGGRTGASVVL
ncbi:MAG: alpha/beta hydrolase family protein [Acidimicrobiales bacterium]